MFNTVIFIKVCLAMQGCVEKQRVLNKWELKACKILKGKQYDIATIVAYNYVMLTASVHVMSIFMFIVYCLHNNCRVFLKFNCMVHIIIIYEFNYNTIVYTIHIKINGLN